MFVHQTKTTTVSSLPLENVSWEHETKAKSPIETPISPAVSLPVSPRTRISKRSAGQQEDKSKTIRWNPSITTRLSLHKNNYTPREITSSWYTPKEYDAIRRDLRAGFLSEGGNPNSEATINNFHNISFRGLERYTTHGKLKSSIHKLRLDSIKSIIKEQYRQVEESELQTSGCLFYNDTAFRCAYRPHSKAAAESARLQGIADSRTSFKPTAVFAPEQQCNHKSLKNLTLVNNDYSDFGFWGGNSDGKDLYSFDER